MLAWPRRSGLTLQMLVALAVVAAASLNPLKPGIPIIGFVRSILIETGMHAGFACGLVGISG